MSTRADEVIGEEEKLGQTAILKGFHHKEWAYWLQEELRPKPKKTQDETKQAQKWFL
jgi:hypothetical protein